MVGLTIIPPFAEKTVRCITDVLGICASILSLLRDQKKSML